MMPNPICGHLGKKVNIHPISFRPRFQLSCFSANIFVHQLTECSIPPSEMSVQVHHARVRDTQTAFQCAKSAHPCQQDRDSTGLSFPAVNFLLGVLSALKLDLLINPLTTSPLQPDTAISDAYSKELAFIIGKMLEKDARRRPSPDAILKYSAVQLRLERAAFKAREEELRRELEHLRGAAGGLEMSCARGDKAVQVADGDEELLRLREENPGLVSVRAEKDQLNAEVVRLQRENEDLRRRLPGEEEVRRLRDEVAALLRRLAEQGEEAAQLRRAAGEEAARLRRESAAKQERIGGLLREAEGREAEHLECVAALQGRLAAALRERRELQEAADAHERRAQTAHARLAADPAAHARLHVLARLSSNVPSSPLRRAGAACEAATCSPQRAPSPVAARRYTWNIDALPRSTTSAREEHDLLCTGKRSATSSPAAKAHVQAAPLGGSPARAIPAGAAPPWLGSGPRRALAAPPSPERVAAAAPFAAGASPRSPRCGLADAEAAEVLAGMEGRAGGWARRAGGQAEGPAGSALRDMRASGADTAPRVRPADTAADACGRTPQRSPLRMGPPLRVPARIPATADAADVREGGGVPLSEGGGWRDGGGVVPASEGGGWRDGGGGVPTSPLMSLVDARDERGRLPEGGVGGLVRRPGDAEAARAAGAAAGPEGSGSAREPAGGERAVGGLGTGGRDSDGGRRLDGAVATMGEGGAGDGRGDLGDGLAPSRRRLCFMR